jgi:hypothetical protein
MTATTETTPFYPLRSAEVGPHRGAPTLFLNGLPHPGLTFFFGRVHDSAEDIARFAQAGVHLFSGCIGLPGLPGDGSAGGMEAVKARLDYAIAANPRVLILPRVGFGWTLRN